MFSKDPALVSGSLATALQDIISLSIYFTVATLLEPVVISTVFNPSAN
ncbi:MULTISPECIES: hypothetical protein [unclassified Legionella]